jgi:acyl-CoA synthetase (AMP-forming)/AMP-acid ligase II
MLLHDYLEYFARVQPESEFAAFAGGSMSYGEASRASNRIARAMLAAGLGSGARVALLGRNSVEYMLVYMAASKCGVVPVPLNHRLVLAEWKSMVDDAGAEGIFVAREYAAGWDELPLRVALESLLDWSKGHDDSPLGVAIAEADVVVQMYTSGTTGRSKGAMTTHRNVAAQMAQLAVGFDVPRGRCLIVAPLYHVAAFVCALACVSLGGSLYIQDNFVPTDVVDALANQRIRWGLLVPAMIQACLVAVPGVDQRRFPELALIAYGASPIAESTLRRAMEVFRCRFSQGYGMTETTACITILSPDDHQRAVSGEPHLLLSAGRAVLGTEVRVVDLEDQPVPTGSFGEIVARGPQVMKGYWKRDDATAEAIRDGWMHTGDAGRMDADGYVYLEDRIKDMIVSGGENVYPREVEAALFSHKAVADAAAIGVPHDKWGETVKAFVVLRAGASATAEELISHCRASLAGYKCPTSIEFLEALPRNPSGKVLKRELREPYWRGRQRRVAGS